jgi:hypothetical protein
MGTAASISFRCTGCDKLLKAGGESAGKTTRCPGCGEPLHVPAAAATQPPRLTPGADRLRSPHAFAIVTGVVLALAGYANLPLLLDDPAAYRYFPPFQADQIGAKGNLHLGGEYYMIARSLVGGEGFAHPFAAPTGPTAWQGPVLPLVLAGLLWVMEDREGVAIIVVILQTLILIGTGYLVLALAGQTLGPLGSTTAAAVFLVFLTDHFKLNFQFTHDCWINMLALDLLIAGLCWARPFDGAARACGWGLFGGLSALLGPIVGFSWGVVSLVHAWRQRAWRSFSVAAAVAVLTLAPWAIRNAFVFGRWIPVKANLAYEMYQSHCLQDEGLLQGTTFRHHPYSLKTKEGQEYIQLGEVAYMDRKRELLWQAIRADPLDCADRICHRFLGATLWYVPFYDGEFRRPWLLWFDRCVLHPLPFLALLLLVTTAANQPLHRSQWLVIALYCSYLLPYIATSYYDRYAVPLLGMKVLLIVWAVDRIGGWLRLPRTIDSRQAVAVDRDAAPSAPAAVEGSPA